MLAALVPSSRTSRAAAVVKAQGYVQCVNYNPSTGQITVQATQSSGDSGWISTPGSVGGQSLWSPGSSYQGTYTQQPNTTVFYGVSDVYNPGVGSIFGGYIHTTGSGAYPSDASGNPQPGTTLPVSKDGMTFKLWATRAGDVGTIHVDSVVLTGSPIPNTWVAEFGDSTKNIGVVIEDHNYPQSNSTSKDFNLSGLPDGTSEYVMLGFYKQDGTVDVAFEGNLQFPTSVQTPGSSTTNPAPAASPTTSTYSPEGPGDPAGGTTTQPTPAGPNAPGTGGTGTGTTGGTSGGITGGGSGTGFATNSVWAQADPGTPATTQGGTGTGTDSSGNSMDARIANAKAALTSAFLLPTFSTGGAVDKPITIDPGSIGGVSLAFTIHTVPDASTTMGAALDSLRLVIRTFAAVFVAFTLYQCCWKAMRRI